MAETVTKQIARLMILICIEEPACCCGQWSQGLRSGNDADGGTDLDRRTYRKAWSMTSRTDIRLTPGRAVFA